MPSARKRWSEIPLGDPIRTEVPGHEPILAFARTRELAQLASPNQLAVEWPAVVRSLPSAHLAYSLDRLDRFDAPDIVLAVAAWGTVEIHPEHLTATYVHPVRLRPPVAAKLLDWQRVAEDAAPEILVCDPEAFEAVALRGKAMWGQRQARPMAPQTVQLAGLRLVLETCQARTGPMRGTGSASASVATTVERYLGIANRAAEGTGASENDVSEALVGVCWGDGTTRTGSRSPTSSCASTPNSSLEPVAPST